MNSRFLSFGVVVSLALHGCVVLLLAWSVGRGAKPEDSGETIPERPAPSVETNAVVSSDLETRQPDPTSVTEAEADPVAETKPVAESKSEPAPEPKKTKVSKYRAGPRSETKAVAKSDAKPEPKADAKPEPKAEPEKGSDSGQKAKQEPKAAEEREWVKYVVKKGDTLSGLVKEYGCSLSEIARKNKRTVASLSKLKVGQRILLPKK